MLRPISEGRLDQLPSQARKAQPKSKRSRPKVADARAWLEQLSAASPNHHWLRRCYANTGLRRDEGRRATCDHLQGNVRYVESDHQAAPRSGRWRKVPLNQAAVAAIATLRDDDRRP